MRVLFIDASFAFPGVDRYPSVLCNCMKTLENSMQRECRGTISRSKFHDQQPIDLLDD